jgi:hypothetical protein
VAARNPRRAGSPVDAELVDCYLFTMNVATELAVNPLRIA